MEQYKIDRINWDGPPQLTATKFQQLFGFNLIDKNEVTSEAVRKTMKDLVDIDFGTPDERPNECECTLAEGLKCEDDSCSVRAGFCECPETCGIGCLNRPFSSNSWKTKFRLKDGGMRGFVLIAKEPIKKGEFIFEYLGQVFSRTSNPFKDTTMYACELKCSAVARRNKEERQLVVEPTEKGGWARFIAHGHDPNCRMDTFCVGNELRNAVSAIKYIGYNTELVWNYGPNAKQMGIDICFCNSENCPDREKYRELLTQNARPMAIHMQDPNIQNPTAIPLRNSPSQSTIENEEENPSSPRRPLVISNVNNNESDLCTSATVNAPIDNQTASKRKRESLGTAGNAKKKSKDTENKRPVTTPRRRLKSAVDEEGLEECVPLPTSPKKAAPAQRVDKTPGNDGVASTCSDPCLIPPTAKVNETSGKRLRDSAGTTGNEKKKSKDTRTKGNRGNVVIQSDEEECVSSASKQTKTKVPATPPRRNNRRGNRGLMVIESDEEECVEVPRAPKKPDPKKRIIAKGRTELTDDFDSNIGDPCVAPTSKQTKKKVPATPPRSNIRRGNRGLMVIESDEEECVEVPRATKKPAPIKRTTKNKEIPVRESASSESSEADTRQASSSRRPVGRPRTRPLTPPGTVKEKRAVGRPKTNPGPYRCDPCARNFTCSGNLAKHQEEFHKAGPGYACPRCKFVCASKKLLAQHLPVHKSREQRTLFQCPSCLKCFTRKPEVRLHQLREANDCRVMEPKIIRPPTEDHNTSSDPDDSSSD